MQYLKKSFHKIEKNKKLVIINKIISELSKISDSLESDSNGNHLLEYIELDKSDIKDNILVLKQELKVCNYSDNNLDYNEEELMELNYLKKYIKNEEKKLEILNDIVNITVDKNEEYDHNEGWKTTTKDVQISVEFKNNITMNVNFKHNFNGYDNSEDLYKHIYIFKDNKKLEKNLDYYIKDGKYYNGKKLNKNINSMSNFKNKLDNHDFDDLSENELIKILKDTKNEKELLQKEIIENEKNKKTTWTLLLNRILKNLDDKEKFCDYF